MLILRDMCARAGLVRIALTWAIRACRRRKSVPSCLHPLCRRTAPRRARAHASRAAVSTTTAALTAVTGAARPDIPTPVRLPSMRRRSRRRIQTSVWLAAAAPAIAATRAACRRTSGTAHGRPVKFVLYILTPPQKQRRKARYRSITHERRSRRGAA